MFGRLSLAVRTYLRIFAWHRDSNTFESPQEVDPLPLSTTEIGPIVIDDPFMNAESAVTVGKGIERQTRVLHPE